MYKPFIDNENSSREMINTFLGYNHNIVQNLGELWDSNDITVQNYPMLSPRQRARKYELNSIKSEPVSENSLAVSYYTSRLSNYIPSWMSTSNVFFKYGTKNEVTDYGCRCTTTSITTKASILVPVDVTNAVVVHLHPISDNRIREIEDNVNAKLADIVKREYNITSMRIKNIVNNINDKEYVKRTDNNKTIASGIDYSYVYEIEFNTNDRTILSNKLESIYESIRTLVGEELIATDNIEIKELQPIVSGAVTLKDGSITYCDGLNLWYKDTPFPIADEYLQVDAEPTVIVAGTKILLFPYNLYLDIAEIENDISSLDDGDIQMPALKPLGFRGEMEYKSEYESKCINAMGYCDIYGERYNNIYVGDTAPQGIGVGDYYGTYINYVSGIPQIEHAPNTHWNESTFALMEVQKDGTLKTVASWMQSASNMNKGLDENGNLINLLHRRDATDDQAKIKTELTNADDGDFLIDTSTTETGSLFYNWYRDNSWYIKENGEWHTLDNVYISKVMPYAYWLDISDADNPIFKAYSSVEEAWVGIPNIYTYIDTKKGIDGLNEGDSVRIINTGDTEIFKDDNWYNIHKIIDNTYILNGITSTNIVKYAIKYRVPIKIHTLPERWSNPDDNKSTFIISDNTSFIISREIPKLDYYTFSKNRVWGCRYGENIDGEIINQIYASKLGDPTNWYSFNGDSTDSYQLNLGDDEKFTGAFTLNDQPYFFKENYIYMIYGSYPAEYTRYTYEDRGCQDGSAGSIATSNGLVFYKSAKDICIFDGSTVTKISDALGNVDYVKGVGGATNGRYYISLLDNNGKWTTFVYDINYSMWVKLNNIRYNAWIDNNSGFIAGIDDKNILTSFERELDDKSNIMLINVEDNVEWMAQTGAIDFAYPDKKEIRNIDVRAIVPVGALLELYIDYDGNDDWQLCGEIIGDGKAETTVLNIIPQRCDHYSLKFVGKGDIKVISIANEMEEVSDL